VEFEFQACSGLCAETRCRKTTDSFCLKFGYVNSFIGGFLGFIVDFEHFQRASGIIVVALHSVGFLRVSVPGDIQGASLFFYSSYFSCLMFVAFREWVTGGSLRSANILCSLVCRIILVYCFNTTACLSGGGGLGGAFLKIGILG